MKTIFRKGFLLLKGMTRGDKNMRETMFDHIDDMLAVKGAESEMALALQEVLSFLLIYKYFILIFMAGNTIKSSSASLLQ